MLYRLLPSIFFFIVSSSSLASTEYTYSIFEEGFKPDGWVKLGAIDKDTSIPIRIALNQRNLDRGYEYLLDVSDPVSSNYGNFWTIDQVYDTFAPPENHFDAVKEWLTRSGIRASTIARSEDRGWIHFQALAHEVESLFCAKYYQFRHDKGALSIASEGYSIPDSLKEIIDLVEPGSVPTAPTKLEVEKFISNFGDGPVDGLRGYRCDKGPYTCKSNNLTCCNHIIHPGCIRSLYGLPEPESPPSKPVAGNELGIYEPRDKDTRKDLNLFFRKWARFIPQNTHPQVRRYGYRKKVIKAVETALDYDCSYPIIYPRNIKTIVNPRGLVSDFSKERRPPNVISTSFFTSFEYGHHAAKSAYRQCNEYMKLGLLGSSVLQASGDFGAGGPSKFQNVFWLYFPVDCPYITTVGATQVAKNSTVFEPERAASYPGLIYSSGGGFSQLFSAPLYQKGALATYFSRHDPNIPYYNGTKQYQPKSRYKYNRLGRGVPDISSNGQRVATAFIGNCFTVAGTSAAAPTVAGIINKIVEERLKAGKAPLGFLNPAFYANPSMFNDITLGFNIFGDKVEDFPEEVAFRAVEGWDPVTGLGTCNYPKMLEYFMSLK